MNADAGRLGLTRLVLVGALLVAACSHGAGPRDVDGDGFPAGADCDDSDPLVHTPVMVYLDADGDGVGAGIPITICSNGSVPPGYSLVGTDCAPNDPTAWRAVSSLPVDRDGDGITVVEPVQLCLGDTAPAPYVTVEMGNDCDDANPSLFQWVPLYRDQDGDGIGAGSRAISCIGTERPAAWSRIGADFNDLDPTTWRDPGLDELLRVLD